MNHRSTLRKLIHFVTPSGIGLIFYFIFGIWTAVEQATPAIKNLLQAVSIKNISSALPWLYTIGRSINGFLSLNGVGNFALFMFWLILGIFLYLGMHVLGHDAGELKDSVTVRDEYVMPATADRNAPLRQFIESNLLRISALITLFFYVRIMLHEYTNWLSHHSHHSNIASVLFLAIISMVAFHVAVVLIRLILLKYRLLGETMVERG